MISSLLKSSTRCFVVRQTALCSLRMYNNPNSRVWMSASPLPNPVEQLREAFVIRGLSHYVYDDPLISPLINNIEKDFYNANSDVLISYRDLREGYKAYSSR
eukprot:TRINITY_DN13175_c0_g1_i1.p1 TRINITY_DN13175_c0_g1~~TRINITY_DN13175_c0_g1_i1.p1  ORF type:complete len:102 (-),score=7.51 TRINITY_DN13175_c0_g1_i1:72-377(-)